MSDNHPPGPARLDRDQIWQVIDAERRILADLLDDLSDDEWLRPSLCTGWTVRDVAAHLTLQQLGVCDLIAMMARWRGSVDRTTHDAACRRAVALPTGRIVAEIRGMVGARGGTTSASPTWRRSSTSWCTLRTSPSLSAAATTCRRGPRPSLPAGCCPCAGPRRFLRSERWPGSG
jgi:uncharacterized protein (TIGR03083 family)